MSITHEKSLCQFIYQVDGHSQGKLAYRYISVNKIDAYSTQVKPEFRGKGIAGELYNALIDFAKQQQLKIKPSCSYIEKRMERNNQDLIA